MINNVTHPSHYADGAFECIDAMEQQFGVDDMMAYCRINAFKYLWRCKHKKNEIEDVAKARWYLSKYLQLAGYDA